MYNDGFFCTCCGKYKEIVRKRKTVVKRQVHIQFESITIVLPMLSDVYDTYDTQTAAGVGVTKY
jgi:hypothetical protein